MAFLPLLAAGVLAAPAPTPSANVIVVLMDGMRWQEVCGGFQERVLAGPNSGVKDAAALRTAWGQGDREARRRRLMPFLWDVVAKRGVLYGDREAGSKASVANAFHFSYPGYGETVAGFADDARITSNADRPNPNVTVLEWLNRRPAFRGRVAVFAGWPVVSNIVAKERSGLAAWSGWAPVDRGRITDGQRAVNALKTGMLRPDGAIPDDAITFQAAFEYLRANRPRVMWLAFGDTDEYGHEGRYDHYLETAHRDDRFVRTLWEWVERTPGYKGRTTLVMAPDHGRGDDASGDWRHHSAKNPGSDQVWIAAMGPSVRAEGVATSGDVKLAQIAASIGRAVGEDWRRAEPKAMAPLPAFEPAPR